MFDSIIPLATTKKQQSKLMKLQKSFKSTRKSDLETLQFLIYDFFISGNIDAYQACLEIMEEIGFPEGGEALLWPFIEPAYWLKYYLSSQSDREKIYIYLYSLMTKDEPNHQIEKWLNTILSDEWVKTTKEKYENKNNTPLDKYSWGLNVLKKELMQLTYKPLEDSSRAGLVLEIEKIINELKEQFQKINKFI